MNKREEELVCMMLCSHARQKKSTTPPQVRALQKGAKTLYRKRSTKDPDKKIRQSSSTTESGLLLCSVTLSEDAFLKVGT